MRATIDLHWNYEHQDWECELIRDGKVRFTINRKSKRMAAYEAFNHILACTLLPSDAGVDWRELEEYR